MKIRIALLEKLKDLNDTAIETIEDEELAFEKQNDWIVLGHFDRLTTYSISIDKIGPFKSIQKSIEFCLSNQSYYSFPFFLIPNSNDEHFWSFDSTFSAVVKVQFTTNKHEEMMKNLRDKLSCICNNVNEQYHLYETLDLSDAIIFIKTNTISYLMTVLTKLRKLPFIDKIYSYPCISKKALNDEERFDPNDKIDIATVRFSLFVSSHVRNIINKVRTLLGTEKMYSVTGSDDIMMLYRGLDAKRICSFYNNILSKAGSQNDVSINNIITRIGIEISNKDEDFPIQGSCEYQSELTEKCDELIRKLNEEKVITNYNESNWFTPLTILVKLLYRVSIVPSLKSLVFLFFPSVSSFILNLDENNHNYDYFSNVHNINDFIQNSIVFIEQLIRTESQYSNNPELRPLNGGLPIIMLEYAQAFLDNCSNLLCGGDDSIEEKKEKINIILIPKEIDRLETKEIFSSDALLPGLIEIDIPTSMLLNPQELQCFLCHEASHYIGEQFRKREKRLENYSKAVSVLIAKLLFSTYDRTVICSLIDQISTLFDNSERIKNRICMYEMMNIVENWIEGWIRDEKEFCDIIRNIINYKTDTENVPINSNMDYMSFQYSFHFKYLLKYISDLYREIYADICMLSILNISEREYIYKFYDELSQVSPIYDLDDNESHIDTSVTYSVFIIRIYVSLWVTKNKLPTAGKNDDEYYTTICKYIKKIHEELQSDEETDSFIPLAVIEALKEYAFECFIEIKSYLTTDGNKEKLDYIRNNLIYDKGCLDISIIKKYVDEYRNKEIEFYKKK